MKKTMTKKIIAAALALCCLLSVFCGFSAAAEELNSHDTIGFVTSNVPYVQVELKEAGLTAEQISGKIGSEEIKLVDTQDLSKVNSLTYVLIDNSSSMTQDNICPKGSFDELKAGIESLISDNVSSLNHFEVYSIGKGDAKNLGKATDANSAKTVTDAIEALGGDEDATELNTALEDIFNTAVKNKKDYVSVKFLLITDTSADFSTGIDLSEVDELYKYNKIPLFTVCNTIQENSDTFKSLNTVSRNSGGEGKVYNFNDDPDAEKLLNKLYTEMRSGVVATFTTDCQADRYTKELSVVIDGQTYGETIKLDTSANITAEVTTEVSVNDNNSAFIITFYQDGFNGPLPVNNADNIESYTITKSGKTKPLAISKVEKQSDGSYLIVMKKDIYSGKYDFRFGGKIYDLSGNENKASDKLGVELEAKNKFWIFFPYIIAFVALVIVLLVFYIMLLSIKKKKNVTKIKEIFETQVTETVQERHYVQNVQQPQGRRVNLYFKTSSFPQKHISVNIVSSIIIGRSDICDVYIDDAKMSRQHFAIEYSQGVFMISDLESVNGTYVNGVRVQSRQKLNSGDMIYAGLTNIRIEF